MATYIQGLTDYIPEIQPFQPDLNFYSNVMQTRQTRYDDAKKQINDLYGSLLYADMTNPENIKKRENYFKVIDQDIKKISGLDLSLQQNVDQAVNVFKGFHDDKYMPTDMAWTRKYKAAVSKHEILKNCTDPKKCGDMIAWEEGLQELEYKREAFAKADLESTLKMEAPSYTPYFNWKPGVMKYVKDQGISIAKDKSNGKFIVRNKNGELIKDGIETLLHTVYGDDPRISANNYTKAFVTRKNTIRANAAMYGSEEEAEKMYMQNTMQNGIKVLRTDLNTLNDGYDQLNAIQTKLDKQRKVSSLTKAEEKYYQEVVQQKQLIENTRNSYQSQLADIEHNMKDADLDALNRKTDLAQAALYFKDDVKKMAESLSHTDEEVNTIQKVDPDYEQRLKKDLAKYENDLGMIRDAVQSELKKDETYYAAFFKERKKDKDKKEEIPFEEAIPVPAVPGGTKKIADYEEPKVYFAETAKNMYAKAKTAGSEESLQVLWETFNAAREAAATKEGVGARKYLQKFYGNKWQNAMFMNMTSFKGLVEENNRDAFILMHDSDKYLTDKGNDVRGWGDVAKVKNNSLMAKANMQKFGANSEIDYFQNGIKKVLDNMSATKEYKYAKYLPNKYGKIHVIDDVPTAFSKAYLDENRNADVDDVINAYNETKEAFFREYVKADQTSIEQGEGLSGLGMMTGIGKTKTVNSNDPEDEFNNALIETTNKGFANPGAVKVIIGNAGKENYDANEQSDPSANGFLSDFLLKVRGRSTADKKKPLYRMLVQGMAADDNAKSSFTVYPSKEEVDDYFKDSKEVKESGIKDRIMTEGITYVYDNTKITSKINEYMNVSPIEKQLLSKGSYAMNEFAETAGTVRLSYNPRTKVTTIQPTYVVYDDSEQGYSLVDLKPTIEPNIKKVQAVIEEQIVSLNKWQNHNLVEQEKIRLANKSKTQQ